MISLILTAGIPISLCGLLLSKRRIAEDRIMELERRIADYREMIVKAENKDAPLTPLGLQVLEARRAQVEQWEAELSRETMERAHAQPVAWQYRFRDGGEWTTCGSEPHALRLKRDPAWEIRPLYTAPPRPDVSGLIEAAKLAEQYIDELKDDGAPNWVVDNFSRYSGELRARAADRSVK